eukprot:gnl/TRDRNA2_/TRDRNA2_81316_c0_seq1.p1 gnl/TRDRNA2_/TRDRNA2_81316_c0~~gnl/TRDRNA2_/TRDRNA2_81316_c0_seq1.p1  ORF type:complete len:763 (-),score=146.34 gnl/TRDRNA2_/TRDRNA2_81316_c0_seq1:57-2345(-)
MMGTNPGSSSWPMEPAQRVGPFVLGMGINEALAVVHKLAGLDSAEVSFDEKEIFASDLTLRIPSFGLQLCFDGFQQDLRVIALWLQQPWDAESELPGTKVPNSTEDESAEGSSLAAEPQSLPTLTYGGRIFAGCKEPLLCFRDVYTMFGPTWIGDFQRGKRAAYFLRYPGLTFEFPLPEELFDSLAACGEHPSSLADRPPPTAARLWVFPKEAPCFTHAVSARPDGPEAVVVRPASGVELRGRMLRFGAMPQDVFSDFGPPEQVCVKEVDTVRIHSALSTTARGGPDYYYNYFHLGLDVLFDGRTHLVKKVILHTNPPTHELFSRYSRCFFQIPIETPYEPAPAASEEAAEPPTEVAAAPPDATPEVSAAHKAAAEESCIKTMPSKPFDSDVRFVLEEAAGCTDREPLAASSSEERAPLPAMAREPEAVQSDEGKPAGRYSRAAAAAAAAEEEAAASPASQHAQSPEATPMGADGEAASDDQEFRVPRKISKRERKAERKNRQKPRVKGDGVEASPQPSPDPSPDPSPILATLGATSPGSVGREPSPGKSPQASCEDALAPPFDELPPPAVPLDGAEGGSDGDKDDGGRPESTSASKATRSPADRTDRYTRKDEAEPSLAATATGAAPLVGTAPSVGTLAEVPAVAALRARGGSVCIDASWPWADVQEELSRSICGCGRPLVVSHGTHTPFGSTYFYAFPALIFEVMHNGFIASVTVFSTPHEELPAVFNPQKVTVAGSRLPRTGSWDSGGTTAGPSSGRLV